MYVLALIREQAAFTFACFSTFSWPDFVFGDEIGKGWGESEIYP